MDSQPWQQAELVAQHAAQDAALDVARAPVLSPLALHQQIVARATKGLIGVGVSDGETIWEYPPEQLPTPVPWPVDMDETAREAWLRTRHTQNVWRDSSFGRISSDGKRVFFVDQAETGEADPRLAAARQAAAWRGAPQSAPPSSNVLVALDATRQGAFAWMVGGATGHSEPELAGAFFLGPPSPVDGLLYAIAETAGRVRLVALSPDTGRARWSLTLAELDARTIVESPTRSFAGVMPPYARGILVCDTSAGGVVAVDLASRKLLWGYQYRDVPEVQNATRNPFLGWPAAGDTPGHWFDADVLIVGTQVLVAADDDELLCLDLESGALRWNRPRSDTLYLASAGDQLLLLVGTHRFTALRVSDGSHAWSPAEYVAIPGGGMPRGRGLFDGTFFYLPTTDPELLKIDIAQGTVVERRITASPLGNLIMHGPVLISQTESVLTAFEAEPQALAEGRLPSRPRREMSQLATAALLTQLADLDYFEREAATKELLARGDAAIPGLAKGAAGQDTEVAFRCTSALLQFLDAADSRLATRSRLELAALTSRAATRFAADAYARESRRRAAQALVRLPQLGATASPDGKSVTLSPTWSGGSDGLAQIGWLLQVESLELRHPSVDDAGITVLARMPNVKSLNLNRSTVTSAALRHLAEWPKLETLLLQGTQVDDSSVEHLTRMRGLRGVNLLNTRLTAQGVARLRAELPNAKILY
jgi:outer membrane protein assembly factor BamB